MPLMPTANAPLPPTHTFLPFSTTGTITSYRNMSYYLLKPLTLDSLSLSLQTCPFLVLGPKCAVLYVLSLLFLPS